MYLKSTQVEVTSEYSQNEDEIMGAQGEDKKKDNIGKSNANGINNNN